MKEKIIKPSKRGLTFSFPSKGSLSIGHTFDYLIDTAAKTIRIVPAASGR